MEKKVFEVSLDKNPRIKMHYTPGHFCTIFYHTNYYLDVSTMKACALTARDVARQLAVPYVSSAIVDTIVCMENTKVIGAFLAQELLQEGTAVMNSGGEINVVTPMNSFDGRYLFYDNELEWIENKSVLLLTASVIGGRTLNSVIECVSYYSGTIAGVSSLFLYDDTVTSHKINSLFTADDLPGYQVFPSSDCDMCKVGQKLDAIISSEGYKKI